MVDKKLLLVLVSGLMMISFVLALPSSINIVSPVEGNNYDDNVTSINWSFNGALNSTTDFCWYQLNGGSWVNFSCSSNVTGITSIEGNDTWKLKINDSTNSVEKTVNFWVDSIFPSITINYPSSNPIYLSQNFFIVNTTIDETNEDTIIFKVSTNSSSLTETRSYSDGVEENFRFPSLGSVPDGNYSYSVKANDTIAHLSEKIGVVVLDRVKPSVSISSPANGSVLSGDVTIFASASDDRAGVENITLLVDGIFVDSCSSNCSVVFNTSTISDGTHELNATAYDKAGNSKTASVIFDVDNNPPSIFLIGANPQVLEVFSNYTELGATANDTRDGNLTSSISIDTSALNMSLLGNYSIVYSVSDSAGNNASTSRIVSVVDTTIPVIVLNGDNPQEVSYLGSYTEQGANASDNYDGDISGSIVINSSSVNTSQLGSYNVTYDVSDSSGNSATRVIRTINVVDNQAPSISITNPASSLYSSSINSFNFTISDPSLDSCWYSIDSGDTNISTSCSSGVALTSVEGSNTWAVYANDTYGNENHSIVVFTVDTIAPEISVVSPFSTTYTSSSIPLNVTTNEASVSWKYSLDFGLTNTSFVPNSTISLGDGDYNLTVYVKDTAGNENYTLVSFSVSLPKSSSSGGGGGGSCGTKYSCTEWTSWSSCVGNIQERSCTSWEKNQACGSGVTLEDVQKLTQSQACSLRVTNFEDVPEAIGEEPAEETRGFFSTITGGVIGVFGSPGRTIIGFIGILAGLAAIGFVIAEFRHRFASKY